MAVPRVTQQFIENVRGDTAVVPPKARVSQQFIESIRSIDVSAGINDTVAESTSAADAVLVSLASVASFTEAANAADTVSASAMLVATLAEAATAVDTVLTAGGNIFTVSIAELVGTDGVTDAILFPGGSVFSVAVIEEQIAIDDAVGFPPVDVIVSCDEGVEDIDVIGGCEGEADAYGLGLYGGGFYGGATMVPPVAIVPSDELISRITIIGAETCP